MFSHDMILVVIFQFGFTSQDFSQEHMDKLGHGIYTPLDITLLPPLYLIYAENPSDSGKVCSIFFFLLLTILAYSFAQLICAFNLV
jgi:hypothetical protein